MRRNNRALVPPATKREHDRALKGLKSCYKLVQRAIDAAQNAGDYYESTTDDTIFAQRAVKALDKYIRDIRKGRNK